MKEDIVMNKIAVIYASIHHGNTKKLVQKISEKLSDVDNAIGFMKKSIVNV